VRFAGNSSLQFPSEEKRTEFRRENIPSERKLHNGYANTYERKYTIISVNQMINYDCIFSNFNTEKVIDRHDSLIYTIHD